MAPLSAITSTSMARRHIDSRAVKTLADLALGFGHEGVGAKDFIDFRHRFGAERQGGNRLRAADVKDIAHAAQLGGIEDSSAIGGGEHSTTCWQPAMRAGVASISTVENSGAEPPGI